MVSQGGGEDGLVGPDYGGGEVVVGLGVGDGLEAHADWGRVSGGVRGEWKGGGSGMYLVRSRSRRAGLLG